MTDTTHLDNCAAQLVESPDSERIASILQSRFIEYKAAQRVRRWVDSIMQTPRALRPPCLMIVGASGAGKTSLLLHLQRRYPEREDASGQRILREVVLCDIPPCPEIDELQYMLLHAMGAPPLQIRFKNVRNDLLCRYATDLQTRVIIFDQLEHVSHLTHKWQLIVMDWLKWVSTSTRTNVIAAGTESAEGLLRVGPQLESRFMVMQLPLWTPGQGFGVFLQAYERSLPLRRPSQLWDLRMQRKILNETRALHVATGATDGIVRVIRDAAIAAIRTGTEKISADLLSAWQDLPMLREEREQQIVV